MGRTGGASHKRSGTNQTFNGSRELPHVVRVGTGNVHWRKLFSCIPLRNARVRHVALIHRNRELRRRSRFSSVNARTAEDPDYHRTCLSDSRTRIGAHPREEGIIARAISARNTRVCLEYRREVRNPRSTTNRASFRTYGVHIILEEQD